MGPELMRRRGTKAGLALALELAFPGVPLRVEDGGSVTWSLQPDEPEPEDNGGPSFVMYCDVPLPDASLAVVARLIEQSKPAHVTYRLRGRAAPSRPGEGT